MFLAVAGLELALAGWLAEVATADADAEDEAGTVFAAVGWLDELEQAARETTPASTAPTPQRRAWAIRNRIVDIPRLDHAPRSDARGTPRRVPNVT